MSGIIPGQPCKLHPLTPREAWPDIADIKRRMRQSVESMGGDFDKLIAAAADACPDYPTPSALPVDEAARWSSVLADEDIEAVW